MLVIYGKSYTVFTSDLESFYFSQQKCVLCLEHNCACRNKELTNIIFSMNLIMICDSNYDRAFAS